MAYEQQTRAAAGAKRANDLTLEGRAVLTVGGVEEVLRFDEREICMRTGEGDLTVRGEDMTISRLNVEGGDVHIRGRISELCYEDSAPERGLLARLFH